MNREAILAEMADYMGFAWDKALDHRGLSAGRSVEKIKAWLFLLGDTEAVEFADQDENYPQYGCPVLMYVSQRYGLAVPRDDAAARMASGRHCGADYPCGCEQENDEDRPIRPVAIASRARLPGAMPSRKTR